MALISCPECSKEVSDKAPACPNCGVPVALLVKQVNAPKKVVYDGNDLFTGTMSLMVKLSVRAVKELNWMLDQADETSGIVSFQTKMSWGSWSGISCTLIIEEYEENRFKVSGTGKQNIRGSQLVSIDLGESQSKVKMLINKMIELTGEDTNDIKFVDNLSQANTSNQETHWVCKSCFVRNAPDSSSCISCMGKRSN